MTEKNRRLLHNAYAIALSVLIVAVGVCYAVSCVIIYKSGASPFTAESISRRFDYVCVPSYICIAAVIGGLLLDAFYPHGQSKRRPLSDKYKILKRLRERADETLFDNDTLGKLRFEARLRFWVRIACTALCIASVAVVLPYLFELENFTVESLNGDVMAAALRLCPSVAVGFAACVAAMLLNQASISRELEILKNEKNAFVKKQTVSHPDASGEKNRASRICFFFEKRGTLLAVRGAVFLLCVLFIVLGVLNNGMKDVLEKAIKICTECIGLG